MREAPKSEPQKTGMARDMSRVSPLDDYADLPRWLAWRNELRGRRFLGSAHGRMNAAAV